MPEKYHSKCIYIPENAIDPERFTVVPTRKAIAPIRVIFVGRIVPYKGPDMLLEAAEPLLRDGKVTLSILGDGPMLGQMRQRIDHERIPGVELPGMVPHQQLQHYLANADLFAFPSIREFGGAVVLEAMAMGCVPIVVDYGGPGELVTEATGVKLPLGTRAEIVQNLRQAMAKLVAAPAAIDQIRPVARQRVFDHFTWPQKAKQVHAVYERVLN